MHVMLNNIAFYTTHANNQLNGTQLASLLLAKHIAPQAKLYVYSSVKLLNTPNWCINCLLDSQIGLNTLMIYWASKPGSLVLPIGLFLIALPDEQEISSISREYAYFANIPAKPLARLIDKLRSCQLPDRNSKFIQLNKWSKPIWLTEHLPTKQIASANLFSQLDGLGAPHE